MEFYKNLWNKKKKRNERSVAARHRNASPPKTIKYHIFLFPLRDGIFARSVTPFFHIEIQIAKAKKIHTRPVFLFFHFSSNVIHAWNVKQIYAQTLYIRIFSSNRETSKLIELQLEQRGTGYGVRAKSERGKKETRCFPSCDSNVRPCVERDETIHPWRTSSPSFPSSQYSCY